MYYVRFSDDPIGFRPRIILSDRDYGTYSGSVPATNPGNRPARLGAVVTPAFFSSAGTLTLCLRKTSYQDRKSG